MYKAAERDEGVSFSLTMEGDPILDLAVNYALYGCYREELTKEKKKPVRKRATKLEEREIFLKKKKWKVYVISYLHS